RITALLGDAIVAGASFYLAFLVRTSMRIPGTETLLPLEKVRFTPGNVLLVASAQALAFSLFGLYGSRERFREPLARLLLPALLFQLAALASIYFLAFAQPSAFPRSVVVLYVVIDGLLVSLWRMLVERAFPPPRRLALIVGTGPAAILIADAIRRHPWTGVEVAGLVGPPSAAAGDLPILGPVERLAAIARETGAGEIILTPEASSWRDGISESLPRDLQADLLVWPSPFETMIGRLRFRIVGDLPLLEARTRPFEGMAAASKRTFDILVSGAFLLVSSPILGLSAAAIALTSRGGVFFDQTRVGKDGSAFRLWKLRTMRAGAEEKTGAVLSSPGDPRVTSVGRILRALRIDELPQLWNVLVGEMSLVGPRPERPEFTERFSQRVAGYSLRHAVRPGLTGLAQVSGDYGTEPDIKLRYDLAYLNNWSFGLDLSILLRTLPVVLTRRGV
ncbi:MAG TPA: sugar transferase, partial [Thermoanaerobaculia bacterium]|nr:sugar transferase [Thermoanaerobaculia bacterium]